MKISNTSKSGFTLLEMLVASLLLGMLVSILTMVFNSSSIAWRTGKAGVSELSLVRRQLSYAQHRADSVLPRVSKTNRDKIGYVVSPWAPEANGGVCLRTRSVQDVTSEFGNFGFAKPSFSSYNSSDSSLTTMPFVQLSGLGTLRLGRAESFTVGVLSWGPDRKPDTADDISTWPDKVE